MTTTHTVELTATDAYWRESYGQLMQSVTHHPVAGKGLHNRSHNHVVEVWENRPAKGGDHKGEIVDPHGRPTDESHYFGLKAQATVLTAHPGEPIPMGATITVGDTLTLTVNGYPLGTFRVEAQPLADPRLVRI